MRMMLRFQVGNAAGSKAVKDGSMGRVLEALMSELKPESAYFFTQDGKRTGQVVFQMNDSADMPRAAERLFQELDAAIEVCPVMNLDDLRTGLGKLR